MKTLFVTIVILCNVIIGVQCSIAQNTFPSSGNAGIGTTSPFANLEIKANQANALMLDPFGAGVGKTSELRFRELNTNGNNYVGLKAPDDISTNLIWVMPASDGSSGEFLSTDGAGNLSWKSSTSDANKSLSNLSSPTKVNQSLIPDVGGGKDLGSSVRPWSNLYIAENIFSGADRIFSMLGSYNTFVGASSGMSNSGSYNTFVGENAGRNNATGSSNCAHGSYAFYTNSTGSYNVTTGVKSLYLNTTGFSNAAYGYSALYSNTSGYNNVASGYQSLYSNTTGYENTACGISSLNFNSTGYYNVALGGYSLYSNTTGYENTACGISSLSNNSTGNYNVAMGGYALYSNATGSNNEASGFQALYSNTGNSNTANGYQSLFSNSSGANNTASGSQALYTNTSGQNNVATGYQSLYSCNGSSNTANGYQALYQNTGSQNTGSGFQALYTNTSGNYNTADGYSSGSYNDNSSYCTFIGYDADQASNSDFSNATAIGWTCRLTASDQVRIGNSTVTSIGGYANWSNVSDGRFKKEVKEDVPGLAFINKLRPVTYHLDITGIRTFTGEDRSDAISKESVSSADGLLITEAIKTKENIVYSGFVAQEVESAAREVGYDFSGVDAPKNENDLYGLRYNEFVVPLVKAVQELSEKDVKRQQEVEDLKTEISELKAQLVELRSSNPDSHSSMNNELTKQSSANSMENENIFLGQNIPNPFDQSTVIPLRLPADCRSAYVAISASPTGRIVSLIQVACNQTFVTIESGSLPSGSYYYTLYVDQQPIGTKQMLITK